MDSGVAWCLKANMGTVIGIMFVKKVELPKKILKR